MGQCFTHMEGKFPFILILASDDFCCMLINFANSFDPDQDRHHVGPNLESKHLTLIQCS